MVKAVLKEFERFMDDGVTNIKKSIIVTPIIVALMYVSYYTKDIIGEELAGVLQLYLLPISGLIYIAVCMLMPVYKRFKDKDNVNEIG